MNASAKARLRSELDNLLAQPCLFKGEADKVAALARALDVKLAWRRFEIDGFDGYWTSWVGYRQALGAKYLPPTPGDIDKPEGRWGE